MNPDPRVFLDSSALIAGVWSPSGGGRELLRLGESGAIELCVSSRVLSAIEAVLHRKAPDLVGEMAMLLDRGHVQVVSPPDPEMVARCTDLAGHAGDGHILADACSAEPDYFVTLDRKHLLGNRAVAEQMSFPIGTPGDCIVWLRDRWAQPPPSNAIASDAPMPPPYRARMLTRRSRLALVTTEIELEAMANSASTGCINPRIASGIMTTL